MSECWTRQHCVVVPIRLEISSLPQNIQRTMHGIWWQKQHTPLSSLLDTKWNTRNPRFQNMLFGLRKPIRAQYLEGSGPMRVLHSTVPPARYLDISDIRHALSVVTVQCLNDSFSSYLTFLVNIKWLLLNRITCYSNPKPSKSYKCYAVLATCL